MCAPWLRGKPRCSQSPVTAINPRLAATLAEKAADLQLLVDELSAGPSLSPEALEVSPGGYRRTLNS